MVAWHDIEILERLDLAVRENLYHAVSATRVYESFDDAFYVRGRNNISYDWLNLWRDLAGRAVFG